MCISHTHYFADIYMILENKSSPINKFCNVTGLMLSCTIDALMQ